MLYFSVHYALPTSNLSSFRKRKFNAKYILPIQNLNAVSAETKAMMEAKSIDVLFATDLCN